VRVSIQDKYLRCAIDIRDSFIDTVNPIVKRGTGKHNDLHVLVQRGNDF